MKIFFTSDLHFGHDNIIQYCNRPFSNSLEMTEHIIANWNSVVSAEDLVYVVGDVFLHRSHSDCLEIMNRLNGTKILIRGNHDRNSIIHYQNIGFSAVLEFAILKIAKKHVHISHYPFRPSLFTRLFGKFWNRKSKDAKSRYQIDNGQWLIHGHTHSKVRQNGRAINVGLEANKYKPISMSEIESIISRG